MAQGDRPYAIRELSQSKFVDYTNRSLSTITLETIYFCSRITHMDSSTKTSRIGGIYLCFLTSLLPVGLGYRQLLKIPRSMNTIKK